MIDIQFTITKNEYIEAQRLYIKRKQRKRRMINRILLAVLVLGTGIVVTSGSHSTIFRVGVIFGCAALAAAMVFLGSLLQRYVLSRRFKAESKFLTNAHAQIDADAYRCNVAEIGEGTTNWTAFNGWLEGPSVFVIVAGYTFRPIPKRSLSAEQQDALRSLLSTKIVRI